MKVSCADVVDSKQVSNQVMTFDMTSGKSDFTRSAHHSVTDSAKRSSNNTQEVLVFDMHNDDDGIGPETRKLRMEEARRRKIARLQSRAEKYRQRRELRIKERVARVQEQQKKDQRIEALQSHDIMGVVGSHWSRNDEISDVNNREHQAWQGIEMEIQGTSPGPLAIEAVEINDGADNRNASVRLHKRRPNTSRPSLLRQPSASLQKQRTTICNIASKAKPSCGISNKRAILSSTRQLRAEYGIDDEPYDLSSKTTKKVQS